MPARTRTRCAWVAAVAAVVVGLLPPPEAHGADSKWVWDGVDRIVAVGDVHGRYDQLTALLQGTGLTDGSLRWTGGENHFVMCGDLTNRGPDDRAVVDLAMRLQEEAEAAGGRVHVVLGNHEVMNLTRDFRYVRPGGWASFASEERDRDRDRAWKRAERSFRAKGEAQDEARAAFDEKYPAGYFARREAFSRKGDYGEWLLDQPTVVKVNGILFVHGGLTPEVASLGLDEINETVRKSVEAFLKAAEVLEGVIITPASFGEVHGTAQQVLQIDSEGRPIDRNVLRAAEVVQDQIDELAFAPRGPLWYRGSSLENERIERERVAYVLEVLEARSMMVGHTVTRTGRVSSRFDGRLIRGDVGMGYGRPGYAVVFEGEETTVFDPATRVSSFPFVEPPYGEGWTGGSVNMSDVEMEQFLEVALVKERTEVNRGGLSAELWELEGRGMKLRGVFKDVEQEPPGPGRPESRRYQHELAAYRLDRMLDIGLVPAMVVREVDGRRGALRPVAETALDLVSVRTIQDLEGAPAERTIEAVAQAYGVGLEELREQVVGVRVLDGLMANLDRPDVDKLFLPGEGRVALVDQDEAFGLSVELDPALLSPCRPIPADLLTALRMLDTEELTEDLSDLLTPAQVDAILKRRDRILELCGAPEGQEAARASS